MTPKSNPSVSKTASNKQVDAINLFKKDYGVQKFMNKYRYQYHVTMLPDLAKLVYSAYLEGYNNGLKQFPVKEPLLVGAIELKSDCCSAEVYLEGDMNNISHWECLSCNEPCRVREKAMDECELCDANPITANCNNGGCS